MGELSKLKGLGRKTESYLNKIGIYTKKQLIEIGPYKTYLKLFEKGTIKPNLNFLYALVGAIENKNWNDVAKNEKTRILYELQEFQEIKKFINDD